MPLYEYKCHSCGKLFEVRQSFSDQPLTRHEECGGTVERLISAPALQFKGSGFYINDYAKGKSGSASPASGSSNGGKSDGGSSGSSGDGKSASTSSSSDSGSSGSSGGSTSSSSSTPSSGSSSDSKS